MAQIRQMLEKNEFADWAQENLKRYTDYFSG